MSSGLATHVCNRPTGSSHHRAEIPKLRAEHFLQTFSLIFFASTDRFLYNIYIYTMQVWSASPLAVRIPFSTACLQDCNILAPSSMKMVLCARHTPSQGVFVIRRGHGSCFPSHANEAMGFSRKGMWTHIPAPATETFGQVVPLLGLLPWWFACYSPQTHFLPLSSPPPRSADK